MKNVRNVCGYLATVIGLALLPAGGLAASSDVATSTEQAIGHGAVAAGGVLAFAGHRLLSRRSSATDEGAPPV